LILTEGQYILGIDLGGTNIRMGLVDREYQLSHFQMFNCSEVLAKEPMASLQKAIVDYVRRFDVMHKVTAISLGVPAVVNKNHSYVYSAPNVYGLDELDLGLEMENALGLPVFVDRDVNFILTHDIQTLHLDPHSDKTILGLYLGTGFGNSLYINGRIHLGAHGSAGELGHIPLYGVDMKCPCGQVGCVESLISGRALVNLANTELGGCDISQVFTRFGSHPRVIRFVKDIAIPAATEVTLLDPDYVILGGGVLAMEGFPIQMLMDEIRTRSRHPFPAEDLHFILAQGDQHAGVMGGAMLVMDYLKQGKSFRS